MLELCRNIFCVGWRYPFRTTTGPPGKEYLKYHMDNVFEKCRTRCILELELPY